MAPKAQDPIIEPRTTKAPHADNIAVTGALRSPAVVFLVKMAVKVVVTSLAIVPQVIGRRMR
ncbi:hypothetical protein H4V95_002249 [Arthrobacter sp. CAN_C5]|nr:hypothetical protein [Arthrobacter sp. CAN_C5]